MVQRASVNPWGSGGPRGHQEALAAKSWRRQGEPRPPGASAGPGARGWRLPLRACALGRRRGPSGTAVGALGSRRTAVPSMAAPSEVAAAVLGEGDGGGFGSWLDTRLEALGVDRAVYAAYILGVLQEEEEEEKLDALQGILSAFLVSRVVRTHAISLPEASEHLCGLLHVSLLLLLS